MCNDCGPDGVSKHIGLRVRGDIEIEQPLFIRKVGEMTEEQRSSDQDENTDLHTSLAAAEAREQALRGLLLGVTDGFEALLAAVDSKVGSPTGSCSSMLSFCASGFLSRNQAQKAFSISLSIVYSSLECV